MLFSLQKSRVGISNKITIGTHVSLEIGQAGVNIHDKIWFRLAADFHSSYFL